MVNDRGINSMKSIFYYSISSRSRWYPIQCDITQKKYKKENTFYLILLVLIAEKKVDSKKLCIYCCRWILKFISHTFFLFFIRDFSETWKIRYKSGNFFCLVVHLIAALSFHFYQLRVFCMSEWFSLCQAFQRLSSQKWHH